MKNKNLVYNFLNTNPGSTRIKVVNHFKKIDLINAQDIIIFINMKLTKKLKKDLNFNKNKSVWKIEKTACE